MLKPYLLKAFPIVFQPPTQSNERALYKFYALNNFFFAFNRRHFLPSFILRSLFSFMRLMTASIIVQCVWFSKENNFFILSLLSKQCIEKVNLMSYKEVFFEL